MSLEPLPGTTPAARSFVRVVREYLRDYPELNRLIAGEESTDRQILFAVSDAISEFNGTPPILGMYSLEALLERGQHSLLLRMTACTLIESIGTLSTRNQINYSAGGVNVGVNDKTPLLMGWLKYYKATTAQMILRVKTQLNIEGMMGVPGIFSEYAVINGFYGLYQ